MNEKKIFNQFISFSSPKFAIPYRTKVWREKSLANFTKSPNFIRQTSYHSITIVSIVMFSPNFIRQIDILHIFAKLFSRQTFVLYGIQFILHESYSLE